MADKIRSSLGISNDADDHDRFRGAKVRDGDVDAARHDSNARARLIRALHKRRLTRGITQRQIAASMKTTQSAISDLEKGDSDPRLSTLQRYARAVSLRLQFELHEDVPSRDSTAWTSFVHFRSWRNREFPNSFSAGAVKIHDRPVGLEGNVVVTNPLTQSWRPYSENTPTHIVRVNVAPEPGPYLDAGSSVT